MVTKAPVVKAVSKNPFYTALLISVIIVLTVMWVFRNVDFDTSGEDESLGRLALRTGIYSLLIITGIQFIQNQTVMDEFKTAGQSDRVNDVFTIHGAGGTVAINNANGASGIMTGGSAPKVLGGTKPGILTNGGASGINQNNVAGGGNGVQNSQNNGGYSGGSDDTFVPVGINVNFI